MGTKTEKFNLNQIVATDTPDWLTTYNEDMAEIEKRGLDKGTYDPTGKNMDAFRADSHIMTGYVRPTEPETVRQTDTVSSAIGKIETRAIQAGDMRKATYDKDGDGKVDEAAYADVAGSVNNENVVGRPTTLPNPNAFSLQFNGLDVGSYDGSHPLKVNVDADAIGAASLVGGKVPIGQLPASDAIDSDSSLQLATSSSVNNIRESFSNSLTEAANSIAKDIDDLSKTMSPDTLWGATKYQYFNGQNGGSLYNCYVNASSGSDSNTGLSAAQPMKTITAAIRRFCGAPPLRVNVAAGTYTETLSSLNGGGYMEISGAGQGTTIINGGFAFIGFSHVNIHDLTVNGSDTILSATYCGMRMRNIIFNGSGNNDCVSAYYGLLGIEDCTFNTLNRAIIVGYGAECAVVNSNISGTCKVGVRATTGTARCGNITNDATTQWQGTGGAIITNGTKLIYGAQT